MWATRLEACRRRRPLRRLRRCLKLLPWKV
jgi:hypothetical protein